MVVLRYDLRRVDCRTCGVRAEMVPWADHDTRFTREFEQLVGYLAQHRGAQRQGEDDHPQVLRVRRQEELTPLRH
jgi:transposase